MRAVSCVHGGGERVILKYLLGVVAAIRRRPDHFWCITTTMKMTAMTWVNSSNQAHFIDTCEQQQQQSHYHQREAK